MHEIERLQKLFPDKSIRELMDDYERDFEKPPQKKEEEERPLPNSPYPEEGTLPLKKSEKKD